MSGRLFRRNVRVVFARSQKDKFFVTTDELTVTDLRVQASIEKHLGAEPNNCTMTVYNLSKQSRDALQKKPVSIRLEAGYDGDFKRIFVGDLRSATSTHEGPDWITKIQMGDGDRAFNHARMNRSYKKGIDGKAVLRDIANSMGLKVPTSIDDAEDLAKQFAGGLSLSGPSRDEMTRLMDKHGMSWSVQDGKLQILKYGGLRDGEAWFLSTGLGDPEAGTGVIGAPEFAPPKKPGGVPTLTIKNLLYPEITPGGKIKVESRDINGVFRVESVKHDIDSDIDNFTTTVEATPR